MEKFYVSKKGYEALYEEIERIDKIILKTSVEMGESAKRDNDLRENPEYMDLRKKLMYDLPRNRLELIKKYEAATIIEEMDEYLNFNGKHVILGSRVEIDFEDEICSYTILGTDEGDIDNNIMSCKAPLSEALLGKKVGEIIKFNNMNIKILKIEKSE